MKILALDLSLTATGYAIGETSGTLPPPKGLNRGEARLDWILRQVLQLAALGHVELTILEGYSYASANVAHQLGELGGIVRWGLWKRNIPFVEIAPGTLKKFAAGRGNAKKPEMLAAAIKRLGYQGHDDNEVDALWLLQMGLHHYRLPGAVEIPKAQLEGVDKVKWPEVAKVKAA